MTDEEKPNETNEGDSDKPKDNDSFDQFNTGNQEFTEEESKTVKKLYRSKSNRILFGVCGGLGEYLEIDPLIIRLIFVISIFFGIWGLLIYIAGVMLIQENPDQANDNPEENEILKKENSRIIIGLVLILLGIYVLLKNTGIWYFNFFGIGREIFIPIILIIAGIYIIIRYNSIPSAIAESGKLHRSSVNKKIAGVCGGLGEYLNVDPTLVRILWLIFTFSSLGIGVLIYIIFVIFVPENNSGITNEQK